MWGDKPGWDGRDDPTRPLLHGLRKAVYPHWMWERYMRRSIARDLQDPPRVVRTAHPPSDLHFRNQPREKKMTPAKKAAAKKAPAKKVAARKAAPRRPAPQTPDEKMAAIRAKREPTATFPYGPLYGETWTLVSPGMNMMILGTQQEDEGDSFKAMMTTLLMFVIEEEREEFLAALAADDDFDMDVFAFLQDEFVQTVSDGLPLEPSED